jgi:transcription elongation factor Elf1
MPTKVRCPYCDYEQPINALVRNEAQANIWCRHALQTAFRVEREPRFPTAFKDAYLVGADAVVQSFVDALRGSGRAECMACARRFGWHLLGWERLDAVVYFHASVDALSSGRLLDSPE